MQIKNMIINGYGKLSQKEISLNDGLNVIYGKNESGKSTLSSFIKSMFYGINKNKNGKEQSDQDKYTPWDDSPFKGTLTYIDKSKEYTITREFKNNNTKIFTSDGEDISHKFNKEKSRGIDIGYEVFKIDEDSFQNTVFVTQNNLSVDAQSQHNVIQKLSNYIQSGTEDMSYEEVQSKLDKILREDIGTDRSPTKPKYILKREIANLELQEDSLKKAKIRHEDIENENAKLSSKMDEVSKELEDIKSVLDIKNKYEKEIQQQKFKFDTELALRKKAKEEKEKQENKKKVIDTAIIVTCMVILIIACIVIKRYIWIPLVILIGVILIYINLKLMYKEESFVEKDNFDLITEEYRKKQSKEIEKLEDAKVSKSITEKGLSELKKLLSQKEEEFKKLDLDIHKLKIEDDALKSNLNNLSEVYVDLYDKRTKLEEIVRKEDTIKLAISKLEESYEELKGRVIPELVKDISYSVSKTTNGMYDKITFNDESGIITYNNFGEAIKIGSLSQGALDQVYLGFRLAISDRYDQMPIIFDESFVYFDDERLEEVLKVISEISKMRQIVLLTCSKREISLLDKLGIKYTCNEL